MARVTFTQTLVRHVPCPERVVAGRSVREALEAYFAEEPRVRGYVLDEQGEVRRHVTIFVDGEQVSDRHGLGDAVSETSSIYVAQALSGG